MKLWNRVTTTDMALSNLIPYRNRWLRSRVHNYILCRVRTSLSLLIDAHLNICKFFVICFIYCNSFISSSVTRACPGVVPEGGRGLQPPCQGKLNNLSGKYWVVFYYFYYYFPVLLDLTIEKCKY